MDPSAVAFGNGWRLFLLRALATPKLPVATFSIFTGFLPSARMLLHSPYYAIIYMTNDLVLILLWTLASVSDLHYLSVVACFFAFFANDLQLAHTAG